MQSRPDTKARGVKAGLLAGRVESGRGERALRALPGLIGETRASRRFEPISDEKAAVAGLEVLLFPRRLLEL